MKYLHRSMFALAAALALTGGAWAERMGMGSAPHILGLFKPVVGSGAEYTITTGKNEKMDWVYAVVGKESVNGEEGYWIEMRMASGKGAGMIMKQLMLMHEGSPEIKRMIVQPPGEHAMEMPMGMMGGMMKRAQESAEKEAGGLGEKLGSESITVPAGTFECEHYRTKSGNTTGDVWISTKVSPYGMVKMVSGDTTMVLEKVLTNETSQIKGEPEKMEMPHF